MFFFFYNNKQLPFCAQITLWNKEIQVNNLHPVWRAQHCWADATVGNTHMVAGRLFLHTPHRASVKPFPLHYPSRCIIIICGLQQRSKHSDHGKKNNYYEFTNLKEEEEIVTDKLQDIRYFPCYWKPKKQSFWPEQSRGSSVFRANSTPFFKDNWSLKLSTLLSEKSSLEVWKNTWSHFPHKSTCPWSSDQSHNTFAWTGSRKVHKRVVTRKGDKRLRTKLFNFCHTAATMGAIEQWKKKSFSTEFPTQRYLLCFNVLESENFLFLGYSASICSGSKLYS